MKGEMLTVAVSFFLVIVMAVLANIDALVMEGYVCGRIRAGDIHAEVHTINEAPCDCCPILWNGGIATTTTDLSDVRLYDMADVVTLDGGHYVLECVEIIPCIRVGRWLIGWRGVVKTQGDIIVYSAGKAYRLTRL